MLRRGCLPRCYHDSFGWPPTRYDVGELNAVHATWHLNICDDRAEFVAFLNRQSLQAFRREMRKTQRLLSANLKRVVGSGVHCRGCGVMRQTGSY